MPSLRVFVASLCLRGGDDWAVVLPKALASSRATVVLVSSSTEDAYYERAEILEAIAASRRGLHRVVPVKLEPDAVVPFALGPTHALQYRAMDQLVAEVLGATETDILGAE